MEKQIQSAKRNEQDEAKVESSSNATGLADALKMHQANRPTEAKELYCQLLEADPRNADAWHMLGMLLHQNGENDTAVECVQNAMGLRQDVPDYYSNLGVVY